MVEEIPSYRTKSGNLFLSREAAVREEVLDDLCNIIPELAMIRPRLDSSLRDLAIAMGPMLDLARVPSEGPIAEHIAYDPDQGDFRPVELYPTRADLRRRASAGPLAP